MQECKEVLEWALDGYYAHYKMYLYVFRNQAQKNIKSSYPGQDAIELPSNTQHGLLTSALTEEEHEKQVEEEEALRKAGEEQRQQEEALKAAQADSEAKAVQLKEAADQVAEAARRELIAKLDAPEAALKARKSQLEARLEQMAH